MVKRREERDIQCNIIYSKSTTTNKIQVSRLAASVQSVRLSSSSSSALRPGPRLSAPTLERDDFTQVCKAGL